MMLTPEQIAFVGLLATVITFLLKFAFAWFGWKPGRGPLTIVLYAVSLVLGYLWTGVLLPPFPPYADPITFVSAVLQWIADLLVLAAPVVGLATLIYNLLWEKIVLPVFTRAMLRVAK